MEESSAAPTSSSVFVKEDIKIPHQVFEVIEELRSRRIKDIENDARLNILVREKVELTNKVEELNMKIKLVESESLLKVEELQASNVSQSSSKEEIIRRQKLIIETNEKEIKLIRDEVCKLQLNAFALERKASDQEKKLTQQSSLLENFMKQKSKFESCLKACKEESVNIETAIDKLKSEVDDCKKINKNYSELNKQLTKELEGLKSELKSYECQLTYANAKNARFNLIEEISENTSSNKALQDEINFLKETNKALNEKTENFLKELNSMQDLLSKSQCLVETQASSNKKCQSRIEQLENKLSSSEKHCRLCISDLERCKSEMESAEKRHNKEKEDLIKERNDLQERLVQLTEELDDLKRAKIDLEELNSKWASKNLELIAMISPQVVSQKDDPLEPCQSAGAVGVPPVTVEGAHDSEDVPSDGKEGVSEDTCECSTTDNLDSRKADSNACSSGVQMVTSNESTTQQSSREMPKDIDDVTMVYKKLLQSTLSNKFGSTVASLTADCTLDSEGIKNSLKRTRSLSVTQPSGGLKFQRTVESNQTDSSLDLGSLNTGRSFDNVVHFIVNSDKYWFADVLASETLRIVFCLWVCLLAAVIIICDQPFGAFWGDGSQTSTSINCWP